MEELLLRGFQANLSGVGQALISAPEAERMIEQLQAFTVEDVGSVKWQNQHQWIEKLNLQAHHNAQAHSDEFVVEQFVSLDKMNTLVHDLLVIELWKERVLPHLAKHLATKVDPVLSYLLLYHESAVANLLEVTMYHPHACEVISEEYLLELADWCYRKLQYLNTEAYKQAEYKERTAQQLMSQTPEEDLAEKAGDEAFKVATCSLTILRYLTDNVTTLPMGLMSRLVATNDTIMALLPLIDSPPWLRRRGRVWERFVGAKWTAVDAAERLKLGMQDVQAWLALHSLVVEPKCRAKYQYDEYRKERLLGLKRHMHELLFDQLPVVKDLQRVLDEMALNVGLDSATMKASSLILEQVPVIRDALMRGRDWRTLAIRQAQEHFGEGARRLGPDRVEALLKAFEYLVELEPKTAAEGEAAGTGGATASTSGAQPSGSTVMVDCSRLVREGVYERWCDFTLELDTSRPADPVQLGSSEASTSGSVVHGLRYRLVNKDLDDTRPLPTQGKILVRHGQLKAEAKLELPEVPLRSLNDGPATMWLTVGLLAVDGLALQLKLKKAEKPKERDKVAGVWYAYHAVGGALTVLRKDMQELTVLHEEMQDSELNDID